LLTQFGDNTPTLEATKLGRKSTIVVRIQKLSANHVCTNDLGPTRTDFNLGTPRFEIPSHFLTTDHRLCDSYNIYTINKRSYLQKTQQLTPYFTALVQCTNYLTLLLKSFRAVNKYNSKHNPKHVSIWHTKDSQKW